MAVTLNLIVAQRLVRKICPNCIQSYNLKPETIAELKKQYDIAAILKTLEHEKITSAGQSLESILFYRGKGCRQCGNEGYKGRVGLYEVMEITAEINDLILRRASIAEIEKEAKKQGMLTLTEDGFIKAKNGVTTIEEIIRVTKE